MGISDHDDIIVNTGKGRCAARAKRIFTCKVYNKAWAYRFRLVGPVVRGQLIGGEQAKGDGAGGRGAANKDPINTNNG